MGGEGKWLSPMEQLEVDLDGDTLCTMAAPLTISGIISITSVPSVLSDSSSSGIIS